MINKDIYSKNYFQKKILDKNYLKNFSKKFNKVFTKIKNDTNELINTLNIFSENFNIKFLNKDLKKYNKFSTIAIIGMGGSILGSEAIYNFLEYKIKKNLFF